LDEGRLVRPRVASINTVDLSRAIASLCGVHDVDLSAGAQRIAEATGRADHYVLALIDGLGMEILDRMAPDSFLRRNLWSEISAVFPATTAASLTSIATGLWPGQHSLATWWIYLTPEDISVTVLPFIERFGKRPLSAHGVSPQQLYGPESLFRRYQRPVRILQPAIIADTQYTRYFTGGPAARGFDGLAAAVDALVTDIVPDEPSFSYLYYPLVDATAHDHGPEAQEVDAELALVDRQLERLSNELPARSRILVSADHGLIGVPDSSKHVVQANDSLLGYLIAPPSGEPRVPIFHVKPGRLEGFAAAFRDRFGQAFALLAAGEVEELELLGPAPLRDETRARIGNFVAVPAGLDVFIYGPPGDMTTFRMKGFHGGMTPAEMRVPLVLAGQP
jgi:hypothetical protein